MEFQLRLQLPCVGPSHVFLHGSICRPVSVNPSESAVPGTPCMPYMPISWGRLRGQLIGIYGSPVECLEVFLFHHVKCLQNCATWASWRLREPGAWHAECGARAVKPRTIGFVNGVSVDQICRSTVFRSDLHGTCGRMNFRASPRWFNRLWKQFDPDFEKGKRFGLEWIGCSGSRI